MAKILSPLSFLLVVSLLTLGTFTTACDSDDPGDPSGNNTAGSSGAAGSNSGSGGCEDGGNSTPECEAYGKCATTNCDAEYKQCMGDGYASGNWGGACEELMKCVTNCGCDKDCSAKCKPSTECTSCQGTTIGQCVMSKCQSEQQACGSSQK